MQELNELAMNLKMELGIKFDGSGVKFLEGFIERNKNQIPQAEWGGVINSCGAFLGQCIIDNYGGQWTLDDTGKISIAFDENNKVYPFSKVRKQFENGLVDSIHSLFIIIPTAFKIAPKHTKKWWQLK